MREWRDGEGEGGEQEEREERENGERNRNERGGREKKENNTAVNKDPPNKGCISITDTWFCPILISSEKGMPLSKANFLCLSLYSEVQYCYVTPSLLSGLTWPACSLL